MKRKYYYIILGILIVVIAIEGVAYYNSLKFRKEPVPEAVDIADLAKSEVYIDFADEDLQPTSEITETAEIAKIEIPAELNLKAAFYPQAPFANWDYPWQEACEEASILLVANEYFNHNWTREEFNQQILDMVDWENSHFGSYEHTNNEQTAEMLKEYLKLDSIIHKNPTYEDVKRSLAQGHLIVMTFAGKKLGNPFYTNGGPVYHAMVIKGYKEGNKVITHDVGTKRGEDYVYDWTVIENSMRDWAEPIENGQKMMIEVLPPNTVTNNF